MREADFVKVAKALADPTRYRMLQELRRAEELTCSCMCNRFSLSQPTISHHIKTLEESGLITIRRQGQFHILKVNEALLKAFVSDLGTVRASPGLADESAPPAHKRKTQRRKSLA